LPRAVFGPAWWTDARVWFAAAFAGALAAALVLLLRTGTPGALVRAAQVATVLPLSALALAVGGDDLPVLALSLLALALAARDRSARRPRHRGGSARRGRDRPRGVAAAPAARDRRRRGRRLRGGHDRGDPAPAVDPVRIPALPRRIHGLGAGAP